MLGFLFKAKRCKGALGVDSYHLSKSSQHQLLKMLRAAPILAKQHWCRTKVDWCRTKKSPIFGPNIGGEKHALRASIRRESWLWGWRSRPIAPLRAARVILKMRNYAAIRWLVVQFGTATEMATESSTSKTLRGHPQHWRSKYHTLRDAPVTSSVRG